MKQSVLTIPDRGLLFNVRENTTDEQAILECAKKQVYRKKNKLDVEAGDVWLDLGANVGGFAVHAAALGATVYAVEPDQENFDILVSNAELNGLQDRIKCLRAACIAGDDTHMDLYVCKTEKNKYRHTLVPVKGRQTVSVPCVKFDKLIKEVTAVKMDIEGAEFDIFDATQNWYGVRKLAFEYHFDHDRSVANFLSRMERLKAHFAHVEYARIPENVTEYNFYPAMRIVHCYM